MNSNARSVVRLSHAQPPSRAGIALLGAALLAAVPLVAAPGAPCAAQAAHGHAGSRSSARPEPTVARTAAASLAAEARLFFGKLPRQLSASDREFLHTPQPPGTPFRFRHRDPAPVFHAAPQGPYRWRAIRLPPGNAMHNGGINDAGRVAGSLEDESYAFYFDTSDDRLTVLAGGGRPARIAPSGEAVGEAPRGRGKQAVLWGRDGRPHWLAASTAYPGSSACAIGGDMIVGCCYDYAGHTQACIWQHGRAKLTPVPRGCKGSVLVAANSHGQAAGWVWTKSGRTHACVYEDGEIHDIAAFGGGLVSEAIGINDSGVVVGDLLYPDHTVRPFLWYDGVLHDLGNFPGWRFGKAISINNVGEIVGVAFPRQPAPLNASGGAAFAWSRGVIENAATLVPAAARRALGLGYMDSGLGVNDAGQMLVWDDRASGWHQYVVLSPAR